MATQPQTGLTYEDLQAFPEDNLRREIIDGELIVTAAPATRHQRVVAKLVYRLYAYCEVHGGEVLPAPLDVYFSETNVVEPDVVYVREENRVRLERKYLRSAPDLAVEVSSPSTRRLELVRKRELYERFGVPEYWVVDLDADRVEVYRLEQGRYGHPLLFARGETLETPLAPGLTLAIDDLLGPAEDEEA
jgi:Uma2 family endonuclease